MPNLGSADSDIRATAAQAAHRIVTGAGDCWQNLLRQRPSPLQAEPVHWRHAVRLALDSETPPNEFEERFLTSLLHWHGPPTPKQQATLENVVARLVHAPLRIRF
jgi:hypothetical protein